jgi:hypothetical protein
VAPHPPVEPGDALALGRRRQGLGRRRLVPLGHRHRGDGHRHPGRRTGAGLVLGAAGLGQQGAGGLDLARRRVGERGLGRRHLQVL